MLLKDPSDHILFEVALTVIRLAQVALRKSWTRIVPAETLIVRELTCYHPCTCGHSPALTLVIGDLI